MRHRQRGQTVVIAALAMTTMLGALSMVVDAGVDFVIGRQLQNAADAAALAAVWYAPACDSAHLASAGCQASNPDPTPSQCTGANAAPCTAAVEAVQANWGVAMSLCAGPSQPTGAIDITAAPGPILVVPQVGTYVVTLSCDAPHWFARIFPAVAPAVHISASASAALGTLGANGDLVSPRTGVGTATSGDTTTLTDTSQLWSANQWANARVTITSGTGAGQVRTVSTNSGTSLTVSTPWTQIPDTTSTYKLATLVARLII